MLLNKGGIMSNIEEQDIIKIVDRSKPEYEKFPETPMPEVYNLEIFDGALISKIKGLIKRIKK